MRRFTGTFIDAFVDEIQWDPIMADDASENVAVLPVGNGNHQLAVKAVRVAIFHRAEIEVILGGNGLVLVSPGQQDGGREEGSGQAGQGGGFLQG